MTYEKAMRRAQMEYWLQLDILCNGNKSEMARRAGVCRQSLHKMLANCGYYGPPPKPVRFHSVRGTVRGSLAMHRVMPTVERGLMRERDGQ
nr:hypothetical protein [uncultured Rhodopila sp.]